MFSVCGCFLFLLLLFRESVKFGRGKISQKLARPCKPKCIGNYAMPCVPKMWLFFLGAGKMYFLDLPNLHVEFFGMQSAAASAKRCFAARWVKLVTTRPLVRLWMDKIHFAPPKRPWNDHSPCNYKKKSFSWFHTT